MIDNVNIPASRTFVTQLRVVKRPGRLRDHIDRKRRYLLVKRLMDLIVSSLAILFVLSWLVPLLFFVIRIESKGPLFFLQKRVGFGGRSFYCIKFRTMVLNKEKDDRPAAANDERITMIGKILRQSNLDEFPQFINILLGHMSLVGPRPHMFTDCKRFATLLPEYKFRTMIKPGLAGLAQLKGFHGPALTRESITGRYRWDEQYIRTFSFAVDIKILAITGVRKIRAILLSPFRNEPKQQLFEF